MSKKRNFHFFILLGAVDTRFQFYEGRVMLVDRELQRQVFWCRFTECEIFSHGTDVEPIRARVYLSPKDTWDTLEGRRKALREALSYLTYDRADRINIWRRFHEQPEIKKLVTIKGIENGAKQARKRMWG